MNNLVKNLIISLFIVTLSFSLVSPVFAGGGNWVEAPLNPAFVRYIEEQNIQPQTFSRSRAVSMASVEVMEETDEGLHTLGYVPPTIDTSYTKGMDITHAAVITSQPQSPYYGYSATYDLRTLGRVSSVKNQAGANSCWAHAAMASLESFLLPGESWNFSENNIKNLLSSLYPEGFDRDANGDGGNNQMSTAYLARWTGPVSEADDPYSVLSGISPTDKTVRKHSQEVLFIPDRAGPTDNDNIKWALVNYGAVGSTIWYEDSYYSGDANASYYYNGGSTSGNHEIAIVGWDDAFDRNNFSSVPTGNGAFIAKNSWGSIWGQSGYFYISYYDKFIGTDNAVFTAESPDNYLRNYQYDPLGLVSSMYYSSYPKSGWFANVFTAANTEKLSAVGFYTTDVNTNYEISVYTNPNSGPINTGGYITRQTGTIGIPGYHTIPITQAVNLNPGTRFSVVIHAVNPTVNNAIPVERPVAFHSSKATANPGESYISPTGSTWEDLTGIDPQYFEANVCIKAFTSNPASTLSISSTPPGANIYLDGVFRGLTPTTLAGVTPGSYTVKLNKSNYRDDTFTVNAIAGQTTTISRTLTPTTVDSVTVDGNVIGPAFSIDISPTPPGWGMAFGDNSWFSPAGTSPLPPIPPGGGLTVTAHATQGVAYSISASDKLWDGKPAATKGRMAEYHTPTPPALPGWIASGKVLTKPLRFNESLSPVTFREWNLTGTDPVLFTGVGDTPPGGPPGLGTSHSYDVRQQITLADVPVVSSPLPPAPPTDIHVYKLPITFTLTAL